VLVGRLNRLPVADRPAGLDDGRHAACAAVSPTSRKGKKASEPITVPFGGPGLHDGDLHRVDASSGPRPRPRVCPRAARWRWISRACALQAKSSAWYPVGGPSHRDPSPCGCPSRRSPLLDEKPADDAPEVVAPWRLRRRGPLDRRRFFLDTRTAMASGSNFGAITTSRKSWRSPRRPSCRWAC
jgi:hypothetical protein